MSRHLCCSHLGDPQPAGAPLCKQRFVLSPPLLQSYHYPGRRSHPHFNRVHTRVRETETAVPGKKESFLAIFSSEHSCQILAERTSPPFETLAMLSSVSLTLPAIFASLIDYGIVFPIPWACQSSSFSVFFFLSISYQRPTCSPTY